VKLLLAMVVAAAVLFESTVHDEEKYDRFEEFDERFMWLKQGDFPVFSASSAVAFLRAKLTLWFSSLTLKTLFT